MTLIDTPGLASLNDENSRRTREFLDHDGDHAPDADAVIYLMRHLHRSDVEFLDAFMDRSVSAASPVNAVAVLSRADEIGAGRLDAMESAGRIAERYRDDPAVRTLCATVVPLAGLLAETGLTLREDEAAALRTLARPAPSELELMLLSAEQFCDLHASDLTVEVRRDLLDRLGMFGVRVAIEEIDARRDDRGVARAQAGRAFGSRRAATRSSPSTSCRGPACSRPARRSSRSARLARGCGSSTAVGADRLDREAERIEAGVGRLRPDPGRAPARHRHRRASATPSAPELDRLFLAPPAAAARWDLGDGAPSSELAAAALEVIGRWRDLAADPLADPAIVEVCETAARTGEAIYGSIRERNERGGHGDEAVA